MLALKGTIQGDTVVIENGDIRAYNGKDVILTILDYPYKHSQQDEIDLDSFVISTERGQRADDYVRELRDNDRF